MKKKRHPLSETVTSGINPGTSSDNIIPSFDGGILEKFESTVVYFQEIFKE
jgi:hypothetical protein